MIFLSIGPFLSFSAINRIQTYIIVITCIPLLLLPESPYFLYSKGHSEEAVKLLTSLRGSEALAWQEISEYSKTNHKVNKLELLRDKKVLKTIAKVMFLAICCTIYLSDRFGRKPVLRTSLIGQAIGMKGPRRYSVFIMAPLKRAGDSVHWFMSELSSKIVAETGIPSDRHHLGKIILQSLKDAPDFVLQIDAATGKSENFQSVLERSVRCAECFKELGLKKGDVIVVMAPNHLDLGIPLHAALYLAELESMLNINRAKVIFCQSERTQDIKTALKNITLDAKVVSFDDSSYSLTFAKFMEQYGGKADITTFKTSFTTFPTPVKLALVVSPIQWLSAGFHFLFGPILRYTRLQSSSAITEEHFVELVNKYRKISPETILRTAYGMSETGGFALYDDFPPPGSSDISSGSGSCDPSAPWRSRRSSNGHLGLRVWRLAGGVCCAQEGAHDTLVDSKQLRGGVIFMDELPMTATTKLHRRKLKEIKGDVMALMAPHHLDLAVPFYAAVYLGVVVAPHMFSINRPQIIFCQSEKVSDVKTAVDQLNLATKIVSFDRGSSELHFPSLLEVDDKENTTEKKP
ncbi:Uncharacterized protein OBRU01_02686 [Operophtera brumata]|uniref:AMP-dependent synthetase/ligase domain-containing protein n=1 Tax=Operophtera brumata TaxID=104452 RepID=A0A0L7LSX4_OPEBR|nr:Uncharacterized protein OBRU01_02686 [Operophtera brumata]